MHFMHNSVSTTRFFVCSAVLSALQFAAWQLQIKDKDYDPLVHVAGFLNLAEFLPSPHRCVLPK